MNRTDMGHATVVNLLLTLGVAAAAFLIFQRIARFIVRRRLRLGDVSRDELGPRDRVFHRYQQHPIYVFMFAYFKSRQDPMFDELPTVLPAADGVRRVLDLGCGFGCAGAFLLDHFPHAELTGIDPSAYRAREAGRAWGVRGRAYPAAAPEFEIPSLPKDFDCVIFLDVVHFLNDADLDLTLRRIRGRLDAGRRLILRATVPPMGAGSWRWKLYRLHAAVSRRVLFFRPEMRVIAMLSDAGFAVDPPRPSGQNTELVWFVATAG